MPDVPNRDELEALFARRLGRLNRRHLGRLLELLGDPPDLANVPASFWTEAGTELSAVVLPFSERIYLEAAQRLMESGPIGVEWAIVNEQAATWARGYTFDLVGGINSTSQSALREAISGFFQEQQSLNELRDRLGNIWGPVRAELIASTEVTRASVQGERAIVRELAKQGVRMRAVWVTNRDERVCPICNPLDRQPEGAAWTDPPPAHPRCRCWLNHTFVQEAVRV